MIAQIRYPRTSPKSPMLLATRSALTACPMGRPQVSAVVNGTMASETAVQTHADNDAARMAR